MLRVSLSLVLKLPLCHWSRFAASTVFAATADATPRIYSSWKEIISFISYFLVLCFDLNNLLYSYYFRFQWISAVISTSAVNLDLLVLLGQSHRGFICSVNWPLTLNTIVFAIALVAWRCNSHRLFRLGHVHLAATKRLRNDLVQAAGRARTDGREGGGQW